MVRGLADHVLDYPRMRLVWPPLAEAHSSNNAGLAGAQHLA